MKKLFFAALFLPVFVFALMALGPRADQRREFVPQTMNSDVQRLLQNSDKEMIGQEPFSSKNNNIPDHMIGFYNTDHGLLVTLQTLNLRLIITDTRSRMFILANLSELYLLTSATVV
jgi:hypothetical protein